MGQIMFSSDAPGLHPGHVLESAGPDEHHVVLLEVVTLARYVGGQLPPRGEAHQHTLSIRTVGLFLAS